MMDGKQAKRSKPDGELIPTRATLLDRLRDLGNEADWKEFYNTYHDLIHTIALRAGLRESEAQDVVQETIIGVARKLPEFRYDPAKGSFKTWLYNLTQWRIADQIRKRDRAFESATEDGAASADDALEKIPTRPEDNNAAEWDEEWSQAIINAALERGKQLVHPKQYQIFDLYVFKSWPAAQIARTFKINVGQVYLAKFRVGGVLKRQLKMLQKKYGKIGIQWPGESGLFKTNPSAFQKNQ